MPQSEYDILEKLGSGTYGEVILVRHKQEKRKVVIILYFILILKFIRYCFILVLEHC